MSTSLAVALVACALTTLEISTRPARAYTSSVAMSIVSSGCTSHTWRGAVNNSYTKGYWPSYKVPQSTGSIKYCTTKLRAHDENSKADYYVLDSVSTWTTNSRSNFHIGAPWSENVSSSVASRGSEHNATPTFTRNTGSVNFAVGVSFAGISLSSPQSFRFGTQVNRTSLSSRATGWKGVDVSKLGSTELIYAQAVAEKSVPRYSVSYRRPTYTYSWSRVRQCRGSCWSGWKPTLSGSSQSLTTHSR
jgi:hypothetical protein